MDSAKEWPISWAVMYQTVGTWRISTKRIEIRQTVGMIRK